VVGFTRALRAETRGTGVRTTIVMPGVVRTEMVAGFLPVRGTRIIEPSAVGAAIVKALRTGRPEVLVPPELAPAARLAAGLPARGSDLLKRLLRADKVLGNADLSARKGYERRARL
jgi:short-subunit dehydrogenase